MLVGKTAWYRPAPGFATSANASPAHRDTSWCATWPVIPSGPNVRTVSGATSSMIARTCSAPAGSRPVSMSMSTGPSRKWCSFTPSTSRLRRSSVVRTSPIDSGGQRSSSIDPPSPRVAVTSTTRWPASTAAAIRPAER